MLNNEVLLPFRCHEWQGSLKSPVMTGLFRPVRSFPLDGADGLGSEVEADAVDAVYLVGDAVGDMMEEGVGDLDRKSVV